MTDDVSPEEGPDSNMPSMVLCIPGFWESHKDFIKACLEANPDKANPRYMPLPGLFLDRHDKTQLGLEMHRPFPGLEQSFSIAGQGKIGPEVLEQVRNHRCIVYLTCDEIGLRPALRMLRAARHLLDAGGMALKVEFSGVAHEADRVRYAAEFGTALDLIDMFTVAIGSDAFFYTCGMHHFGLPDVSVDASIGAAAAVEVLWGFNQWNLLENPLLQNERQFSLSNTDPTFAMSLQPYGYDEGDPLNNPHGRWHLRPAAPDPAPAITAQADNPQMMMIADDDPDMLAATAQALAEIPRLQALFDSPYSFGNFMVKKHFQKGEDSGFFWLALLSIDSAGVTARVFEMPTVFGIAPGDELTFPLTELVDWCLIRYGTLVGGCTMRVKRAKLPADRLEAYDQFSGIISFLN